MTTENVARTGDQTPSRSSRSAREMKLQAPGRRLNVNFSAPAAETLEWLAQKKGKTVAEVLRDAVELEKWITEVKDSGGRIMVEQGPGVMKEVIFRR